jgi:hypothetical protein
MLTPNVLAFSFLSHVSNGFHYSLHQMLSWCLPMVWYIPDITKPYRKNFCPPNATTCSYELRGLPSWLWRKCNRLLRLGRPLGAVTLSRWCVWWYIGRWNARRSLKPKSTNYPDHDHHGDPPLQGKIPMVEPGIQPGTLWSVVTDPDH